MIIKTDKEGKDLVHNLLDIALKTGGLSNLQAVFHILSIIGDIGDAADKINESIKPSEEKP